MIIHDVKQNTEEWHEVRRGKFTATKIVKLFMGKSTKGYNDIINRVVYERLTNKTPDSYQSKEMKRGIELEPEAIKAYELETFNKVNTVGFVELNKDVGCSPDGLIGDDGMIQIKCPIYTTLMNYHISGKFDKDYLTQMQAELYVTGRNRNLLYAWHPDLKPFKFIVNRDEEIMSKIKSEINIALKEVEKRLKFMRMV